ncbi:ephrin-B2a isoform X1 [Fundulus heteroclitus]|uniref:ephrin-B2a isoform X1 n=1 Tax=Fundulus heteroclitus TaxID=8078 RepID=UPI00165B5FBC|nr:ephrin-B2a isoform X1 [Fundulus heteroclitus]
MGGLARSCGAVILLAIVGSCRGVTLESVHWSSSNAKFTPGQGLVLYPQIGDKMDIVCPRADPSSAGTEEFYKVYLVTKSQMESCGVDKTDTPLLNCDKPEQDVKFTFKFQEFSPNLWGLEFLKGRDYYITSTSTGSLRGLDNTRGGVCRTKSMKLVLRVGQSKQHSSDPLLTLQESPTRFPPAPPKTKTKDVFTKDLGSEAGQAISSGPGLAVWVISGCSIVLLLIAGVLVALWRYHRRRRVPDRRQQQRQPPASVSLSTLAVPKRDSISSDNGGSDRSEVAFPLRASESMICRHYERGSGEYGPPVYIVQEIMPQSPTNVYYKV